MKGWMGLIAGMCVIALGAQAAEAAPGGAKVRRYALLIGANDGGSERVTLKYAVTDAQAMSRVLSQLGGIPESKQTLVTNPSVGELEDALDALGERIAREGGKARRTEVVVYYSGHSDEQGLLLRGGKRLTYPVLRRELDEMPAQVRVVVLDSCSSGAMTRNKGGARVASFLDDRSVQVEGQAILTSSSADEVAQESDSLGGSFFTHALVAGMRGAADVSGDRRVTLNEAYQFAFNETLARTENTRGGAQHAAYDIHLTGQGDLVLTDLRQTDASLTIAKNVAGKLSVRNADGELSLEVEKVAGRELELALPAKSYEVRWTRDDGSVLMAKADMSSRSRARLKASSFGEFEREETTLRGGVGDGFVDDHVFGVGIDLFPFVGSSSLGASHSRNLSFNIISGISGGIHAFEFGTIANIVQGDVAGAQIGGVTNVVLGQVRAAQIAAGFNMARGGLSGFQLAGVNLSFGETKGVQLGGSNTSLGPVYGVQMGGINLATDDVTGVQFGGINIANGEVEGFQFGLINVAEKTSGAFGIFNFYWAGETGVDAWVSEAGSVHVGVRHGSGASYNTYSIGTNLVGDVRTLSGGIGIGFERELGEHFGMAIDATAHAIIVPGRAYGLGANVNKLRLTFSYSPIEWFSIFGGPTGNVMLTDCSVICEEYLPFGGFDASGSSTDSDGGFRVFLWPGLVLGARF